MDQSLYKLSSIGKIDNRKRVLPWSTTIILLILIVVLVWFFRGGSFRFYASLFFGLYDITHLAWLSIILVGVVQTIIFLPLRFIGAILHPDLKEFESELEKTKNDNQYILFQDRVKTGSSAVLFYILNFVLLALAFFSVGRVFLLDFYNEKLPAHYLYHFIPYPQYPIEGTIFRFPFFKITSTYAVSWHTIGLIWFYAFLSLIVLRFVWILLKKLLSSNKTILGIRISYNHFLIFIGGYIGTIFLVSLFVLRHIPTSIQYLTLSADLAKQNTGFNIITALGTFLATIHAGYSHQKEAAAEARKNKIPETIIQKVFKNSMKMSLRNALLVSFSAFWITRLMPCSHDLSVLSFEALYIISPVTFDLLMPKKKHT